MRRVLALFLIGTGVLSLTACRKDSPPVIENCTLRKAGGGACKLADGSEVFRDPSGMKGYWATNPQDFAKFAAWCYQASPQEVEAKIEELRRSR